MFIFMVADYLLHSHALVRQVWHQIWSDNSLGYPFF